MGEGGHGPVRASEALLSSAHGCQGNEGRACGAVRGHWIQRLVNNGWFGGLKVELALLWRAEELRQQGWCGCQRGQKRGHGMTMEAGARESPVRFCGTAVRTVEGRLMPGAVCAGLERGGGRFWLPGAGCWSPAGNVVTHVNPHENSTVLGRGASWEAQGGPDLSGGDARGWCAVGQHLSEG